MKVVIQELEDPLDLISMDYEDLNKISMSEHEVASYANPDLASFNLLDSEIENELMVNYFQQKILS